jgi:hypothetical protein
MEIVNTAINAVVTAVTFVLGVVVGWLVRADPTVRL